MQVTSRFALLVSVFGFVAAETRSLAAPDALVATATQVVQALAGASEGQSAQARDRGYVTVRATPGLPGPVIEFIARNSEWRRAVLPAKKVPSDFITEICGNYTASFGKVFFNEVNRGFVSDPMDRPRPVWMPACVKWRQKDTFVKVESDDMKVDAAARLDSILSRKIGRVGNQRFVCAPDETSPRCGKLFRELVAQKNPDVNLDKLREGQEITLPFITYPTTFRIGSSVKLTAQEVTEKIAAMANQANPDSAVIRNVVAPRIWLLAPVAADDLALDAACVEAGKIANRPWPYDFQLIGDVIKRNLSAIKNAHKWPSTVVVTIIDTGLDETFSEQYLYKDERDSRYPYGIGIFRAEQFRPFSDQEPSEIRLHGTRVAEILSGGSGLQTAYPDLPSLLRLNIVNVVEPTRSAGEYELTPTDVNAGMEWAAGHAQIANVSIGSAEPLMALQNTLRLHPDLLVVAAAGNETQPITDYPLYPANYGGSNHETGDQVITVAAYDGNLARATFSNWSGDYADVMAPGCDIPYQANRTARLYGTSFAAPLVSMTAGLLWAFGVKNPKEIKRRMQASVDFDQHLQDLVMWSGRLNIAKTLSVYDDVLEFSAYDDALKKKVPILKFGRWQISSSDLCGDKFIDFSDIDKVSVVNDKVPLRIRILYRDGLKVPRAWECEPAGNGLAFIDTSGVPYDVTWADFIDLVPRYFNRQ